MCYKFSQIATTHGMLQNGGICREVLGKCQESANKCSEALQSARSAAKWETLRSGWSCREVLSCRSSSSNPQIISAVKSTAATAAGHFIIEISSNDFPSVGYWTFLSLKSVLMIFHFIIEISSMIFPQPANTASRLSSFPIFLLHSMWKILHQLQQIYATAICGGRIKYEFWKVLALYWK